ncbi:calcium-binding RTX toxin-like protein [Candidatus Symbiobacter mobilis CR]|uniref:Calcium-binding RTX toxin-like protein n=1 Tax=Candidatus Symbiobacter mobilis CR TaxID=946483 RepID=U5N667_9BURK|nr:calcium-binding RTX toxin-like protein [Candidatus Symbiobacter mobilis CR]
MLLALAGVLERAAAYADDDTPVDIATLEPVPWEAQAALDATPVQVLVADDAALLALEEAIAQAANEDPTLAALHDDMLQLAVAPDDAADIPTDAFVLGEDAQGDAQDVAVGLHEDTAVFDITQGVQIAQAEAAVAAEAGAAEAAVAVAAEATATSALAASAFGAFLPVVAAVGVMGAAAAVAASDDSSDTPDEPDDPHELENHAPTGVTLSAMSVAENAAGAVVGTLTTTDPDQGDTHTYTVNDTRFEVVAGKLKLKAGQSLNFEAASTVPLTVTATDAGGLPKQQAFTITVTNVNEAPSAVALSATAVAENAAGAVIGDLTTTDPDAGSGHTYAVSDERFEVVAGALKLKAGKSLDHETEGTVALTVTATDAGGLAKQQAFTITVTDVAEEPAEHIAITTRTVAENESNVEIGTLSMVDSTFAVDTWTLNDDRFEVKKIAERYVLQIKEGVQLNYEDSEDGVVHVLVSATSVAGDTVQESITIAISDVNDAPAGVSLSATEVAENAAGALVGTLTTSDPDEGDTHTYTVSDNRFEVVDGNKLKLKADHSLDHETEGTVALTVTATDEGGLTKQQAVTITVTDVVEEPAGDITLSTSTVAENQPGAAIGDLAVTGAASGVAYTFTVEDDRFEVVDGTLKLKAGISLDYETVSAVTVKVTANAEGQQPKDADITLTVTNVNEAPSAVTLSAMAVAENAAGAVIGDLTTTDPDAGDTHTYTVSDNRFEVIAGKLKLKADQSLNFEAASTVPLTVTATDAGGLTKQQTFTLTVTNVNEAPSAVTLSAMAVAENAAGAVIGDLTTTDPDAGDTHTYTVSDNRFEVIAGKLKLKADQSLNFEAASTVPLTVTATDAGGLTKQQAFTTTVTNVNEAPTAVALSATAVAENAAGAVIGDLTTTDPDAGNTHTYTVSDNRFEVVAGKLKLKADQSLNFEAASTVPLTVTATDAGGLTKQQAFTITVTDVNEEPLGDIALSAGEVEENAAGAEIGTLSVPGATGIFTFAVVGESVFEIVGDKLKLKAGQSFDAETTSIVIVNIQATNATTNEVLTQEFPVTVRDINEAPTAIALSNSRVAENVAGVTIGILNVNDPDYGDSHTFTVDDDDRFEVVNGSTLQLKADKSLDYESTDDGIVMVRITAKDALGATRQQTLSLSVTDSNEAPDLQLLDQQPVAENTLGAIVGRIDAEDPEGGQVSLSVPDPRFVVDEEGNLRLRPSEQLDYEATELGVLTVTVIATDPLGNATELPVEVEVTNVDEAPTMLSLSAQTIQVGAAGAVIGILTTIDPDGEGQLIYEVLGDGPFVVNGNVLRLPEGQSISEARTYPVTIRVTDEGGNTLETTFDVQAIREGVAPTDIQLAATAVDENAVGADIGNVIVTDADQADGHVITVQGDDRFEVVNGVLRLEPGQSLNYEAEPAVTLQLEAKDSDGLLVIKTFTITVNDLEEELTDIALSASYVAENALGSEVGRLTVQHPDFGIVQKWEVDNDSFEVGEGSLLKLKEGVALNFEESGVATLTVTAVDASTMQLSQTFNIYVGNVNESPTKVELGLWAEGLQENTTDVILGELTAADPDGTKPTISVVNDPRFAVDGNVLRLVQPLNFEAMGTTPSVTVRLAATDGEFTIQSQDYVLLVSDVNEAPTSVTLTNQKTVPENTYDAEVGVVGQLVVADPDRNDTHWFQLSDERFIVDESGMLRLTEGARLDYEANQGTLPLTVWAYDSGMLSVAGTFSITITDQADPPTFLELDGSSVRENNPGAIIGALAVHDEDTVTTYEWTVSDGRFEVVPLSDDGAVWQLQLREGATLDSETDGTLSLTVTATQDDAAYASNTFPITVINENEAPAAIIPAWISSFPENPGEPPTLWPVAAFTGYDADVGDETLKWSVNDARFDIDATGQLFIKAGSAVNFEAEPVITVRVTATDKDGKFLTVSFEITVQNVNEAPTAVTFGTLQVSENSPGAVVGQLHVADPDAGDTVAWWEVRDPGFGESRFSVNEAGQLQLLEGVALDYESSRTINLTVIPHDAGDLSGPQTPLTVTVLDAPDAPTGLTLSNPFVAENAAGAVVGTLSVTDLDAIADTYTWQVFEGTQPSTLFEVQNGQLRLQSGVALDFEDEAGASYPLTITVTDAGGDYSQDFTVEVTNVNEAPTWNMSAALSIAENQPGAWLSELIVSDIDLDDTHTFAIVEGTDPDALFAIESGGLRLRGAVSLDYETGQTHTVSIVATDAGGLSSAPQTFTITVTNANDAPTDLILEPVAFDENDESGPVIGKIRVVDQDMGDTHTMEVWSEGIILDAKTLELKLQPGFSLDHEVEPYKISISVKDRPEGSEEMGYFEKEIPILHTGDVKEEIGLSGADGADTFQYTSIDDYTILGRGGNDTIQTGSGSDTIRAGEGADVVQTGNGDDLIVVLGTTALDQYPAINFSNVQGVDVSDVVSQEDLNGRTNSEVVPGDSIDGGGGNNTLVAFGEVNFTDVALEAISALIAPSAKLTFTAEQLDALGDVALQGDGMSALYVDLGAAESVLLDEFTIVGFNAVVAEEGVEFSDALLATMPTVEWVSNTPPDHP